MDVSDNNVWGDGCVGQYLSFINILTALFPIVDTCINNDEFKRLVMAAREGVALIFPIVRWYKHVYSRPTQQLEII